MDQQAVRVRAMVIQHRLVQQLALVITDQVVQAVQVRVIRHQPARQLALVTMVQEVQVLQGLHTTVREQVLLPVRVLVIQAVQRVQVPVQALTVRCRTAVLARHVLVTIARPVQAHLVQVLAVRLLAVAPDQVLTVLPAVVHPGHPVATVLQVAVRPEVHRFHLAAHLQVEVVEVADVVVEDADNINKTEC